MKSPGEKTLVTILKKEYALIYLFNNAYKPLKIKAKDG